MCHTLGLQYVVVSLQLGLCQLRSPDGAIQNPGYGTAGDRRRVALSLFLHRLQEVIDGPIGNLLTMLRSPP